MSKAWPLVKLGEVIRQRKEFITIDDTQEYMRCRVQLHAKGIVLRDRVTGSEIKTKQQQVCQAGEFLVAEIDAKVGGFGIVPDELENSIVSSHYFLFTLDHSKLNKKFLDYYSQTPAFREQVNAKGSTNYAAIRPHEVLNYTIPLPPLAEQQRIVAKIERLTGKIEEAKELRQRTIQTAEILADTYTNIFFSKIPDHTLIDTIAEVRGGIQKSPNRLPGKNPVRYLTVAHVHRNRILVNDPRYFEVTLEELDRWRLLPGDVLIIEGNGSADQIGRTALFNGEIKDCVHQNHVIRIRPNQQHIIPAFINTFFNSPIGKDTVQAQSRTSSGLRTLSVGRIKNISIPIPSIATQHQIIAKLNILQSQVSTLKATQAQTAAELDAMLPSILDRAFKGEL